MSQEPLDHRTVLERAARAAGKLDRDGLRGATNVSVIEIEALVLVLVDAGLIPVWPGEKMPEQLIAHQIFE